MSYTLSVDGEEQSVLSKETLRTAILNLHAASHEKPRLVQLIADNDATMSIGVGSSSSILNYISPGGWPAYTALGSNQNLTQTITFSICDEESEISARFAMPFDRALVGLLNFFDSGHMPSDFEWQQD